MEKFDPNRMTFEKGLQRIRDASEKVGFELDRGIVTSKDKMAQELKGLLDVTNVPDGFTKWQLPVFFRCETQTFLSFAAPNTNVPSHSHNEGPGIRVIISGSMNYDGKDLNAGDWMYIPAGTNYEFDVGSMGVGMFYCYCCSCA